LRTELNQQMVLLGPYGLDILKNVDDLKGLINHFSFRKALEQAKNLRIYLKSLRQQIPLIKQIFNFIYYCY